MLCCRILGVSGYWCVRDNVFVITHCRTMRCGAWLAFPPSLVCECLSVAHECVWVLHASLHTYVHAWIRMSVWVSGWCGWVGGWVWGVGVWVVWWVGVCVRVSVYVDNKFSQPSCTSLLYLRGPWLLVCACEWHNIHVTVQGVDLVRWRTLHFDLWPQYCSTYSNFINCCNTHCTKLSLLTSIL